MLPVFLPPFIPPGTTGLLFSAGSVPLGPGRGSPEILGPPFGPKMKLINFLGPPLGTSFAAEHAPRTLSGPPKNHSERKMKMLKSAQEIHQNLSPGELLPIQDPPKRGSMDLIKFPEGPLGVCGGARCTSQRPSCPPLGINKIGFSKKHVFFANRLARRIF